ncbi:O-linked N-acetylglucosamine transferase, SPINDLY family protein [Thauera butanivorans]|uniref:O-linked N-acetylglucosamine transferase, SPINDLY family protein n=1 Tax=Thauera butanivorans TaxID=86174 RepID=UPI000838D195|nr:tetratricopeptide repeat protein [Thauera butanivorans]
MSQNKTPTKPAIPGLQQCLAYLQKGDIDAFERAARELAACHPQAGKPRQLLGVAALMRGRLQEAVDQLQRAARLDQTDATIWDNLGVALQRAGHHDAAAECYQSSVRLDPNVPAVWCNAAANFGEMGDYVLARNCAARALKLDPRIVEGHLNLGNALRLLGDYGPAVRALLRATELDSACAPAHMGLARAMYQFKTGPELAVKHALRALEIDPAYPDARFAYAEICNFAQERVDALRAMGAANGGGGIQPGQSLLWCLLMDPREMPASLFAAQRAFGEHFEPAFAAARQPHGNDRALRRKLRVGFLSGDFRRHPVADHVLPLWQGSNRRKLSIHAYSTAPLSTHDGTTETLRGLADAWVDAQDMADAALAQRIRDDGIDVLVDLAGHTAGNRVAVLMRKPAPVQMQWIGYPSSTGLSVIDYLIVDPVLAPAGMDEYCSEKLLRLPTYNNQAAMPGMPDIGPLPALANGHLTFGSTARGDKINAEVIALWSRVLDRLPTSRLIVADAGLAEVRKRFGAEFDKHGISRDRVDFRPRGTEAQYMALHAEIDINLDTFPFNGGTTVTHGLHLGVPTVTLRGPFMTQCMAASRLHAVGLDDWIADDADAFVDIAVRKAADVGELATLRAGLRQRLEQAPLRRIDAFATAFEKGLRRAWQRWCEELPPEAIDVA